MPGGQPNMQEMLKQAQKMQQDLMAAQEELAGAQVQGRAGGGLVTATMTGSGELVGLDIAPGAVDPTDTETLSDLVLAAVRDAARAAGELQAKTMGPLAQGLGAMPGPSGGLPGF